MFVISELIVESIIREGIEDLRENLDIAMEDLFGNLYSESLSNKYSNDYEKIKTVLTNNQIYILHAMPDFNVDTHLPSFSIHLQSDAEEVAQDVLGDYAMESEVAIEPEVILEDLEIESFSNGIAYLSDSVDLTQVYYNRWFIESDGNEIKIIGVNNVAGNKYLQLETKKTNITMSGNKIVSAINTRVYRKHEIPSRENIMIGVHSRNSLLTKYLYHILKYCLYKGWSKFEDKGIQLQTFNGTDFNASTQFLPEQVYSRFLTMNFIARNSWRHKLLHQVDSMGNDANLNPKEVVYTFGKQPEDNIYKPRVQVDDITNENKEATIGLLGEDDE